MSELKPCPFCGEDATMQAPNMHRKTCISCKECGMSTGWGSVEAVNKLYWDGLVDREIAERVGFSQQAIHDWRKRHRNPPNGIAGRPKRKVTTCR